MFRQATTGRLIAATIVFGLLATSCGGGSDDSTPGTQAATKTGAQPTLSQAAKSDPTDAGFACSLLTKAEIEAATGSPPREGTHVSATVGQGEAVTSCTVLSVEDCPQNLPRDNPYCDKAYRLGWTVDVYPNAAAATAAFAKDQAANPPRTITVAGADSAVFYDTNGSLQFQKHAALVRLNYNGPGALSGNASIGLRIVAGQDKPAATMAGTIASRLP